MYIFHGKFSKFVYVHRSHANYSVYLPHKGVANLNVYNYKRKKNYN